MSQEVDQEKLTSFMFEFLKQQTTDVGEHLIIQKLSQQGFFESLDGTNASLALFKKHFWTMHGLYRIQEQLQGSSQGIIISPLSIRLVDIHLKSSQSQTLGSDNSQMAQYYLNLSHLDQATEESVDDLLGSFWRKFAQWQSGGDAFAVLGLSEGVSWSEVQKVYRQKAQLEHPDKGGSAEKFAQYSEAYRQLKSHFLGSS